MNELVIPPAPSWYKNSVVACAPDNTVIYGCKNDLVILQVKSREEAPKVEIIHGAHSRHVTSVSLNRKWQEPHSYVASLGEDNIIKVWDLNTLEKKTSNKDHTEHKESVVGAVFAGDDRVVSAAAHGLVIVWNINTNESKPLNDLFKSKVTLTCLSSCPHAGWLLSFGLNNGVVIVADLRRNGQVLYKLRGHYQSVVSLAWCPVPVNVFPQNPKNVVKNKSPQTDDGANLKSVEIKKEMKVNPWVNLVHADDDDKNSNETDHPPNSGESDFLKECDDLTNKILGVASCSKQTDEYNKKETTKQKAEEKEESDSEDDRFEEVQNRSLPQIFDPSGDFLDDSGVEDESSLEEKDEEVRVIDVSQEKETSKNKSEEGKNSLSEVESKYLIYEKIDEIDKNTTSGETDQSQKKDAIPKEVEDQEKAGSSKEKHILENKELASDKNALKIVSEVEDIKSHDESSAKEVTSKYKDLQNEDNLQTKDTTSETKEKQDDVVVSKSEEIIEEEPRFEYLLASSAKDRSVYIWRAGTDGRMQTFFHAGKKGTRRDKHTSTWITLCWITPNTILTSSATGDILAWPVPKPKESHKQFSVAHSLHSACVFNIVTPPRYFTAYDWRQDLYPSLNIWSWSQDSKLINYDLEQQQTLHLYFTVTAVVTCFAPSAVDPNRLAIGHRDGGISVWDLSAKDVNIMSMQKYQQKFTQKVSCVAWHPHNEVILAFGTEEGRVGFIDLNSKKTTMFRCHFRTQVYKLEWGPFKNGPNLDLGLYVLADGTLAIHDINKPSEEPTELEFPDIYKFAWKPSFELLLLNGKDGSLVVLNKDLTVTNTLYPSQKGLNAIVWHPDALIDESDVTSRSHWFAAATNKGVIVFDCRSVGDNFADKLVASFEAHVKPPLCIDWCPFDGNRLVSIAGDGLAQVYDVTLNCVIATFVNSYVSHHVAVVWSSVNSEFIITGDNLLRIWNVKNNQPKVDKEFLAARKRLLSKYTKNEEKTDKIKIKIEIPKPKSAPKNSIVPPFYVSNDENIESQIVTMKKLMTCDSSELEKNILDPLHIFGGKEDVSHLLDLNYQQQKNEGRNKSCELISLWKGSIADHITTAISENTVTPSVIMMAPMVSIKLWQDACLMYAKKLSEDANADPIEAATYFLACHKVQEAIDCLCVGSLFREALALAKQRLPEGSEIITTVIEKWAQHCTVTGNFENAAYCFISIKDYENAAKVLSRRNRKEFLEFAIELAEKAENKGLVDSIKFKYSEIQTVEKEEKGGGDDASIEIVSSRSEAVLKTIVDTVDDLIKKGGEGDASIDIVPSKLEAVLKNIADSEDKISQVDPSSEMESHCQKQDDINEGVSSVKNKEKKE